MALKLRSIAEEEIEFEDLGLKFTVRGLTRQEAAKVTKLSRKISKVKSEEEKEKAAEELENFVLECAISDEKALEAVRNASTVVYLQILNKIFELSGLGEAAQENF